MTSGKSTLGRPLAQKLQLPFRDMDQWIETQAQKTISEIFESEGEMAFRSMESQALQAIITHNQKIVVATGGGAPCFNGLMDQMNQHGRTIYLKLPVEELMKRIFRDRADRPLVRNQSAEELHSFVENLLDKRQPIYEQAQLHLDARLPEATLIREIINHYPY